MEVNAYDTKEIVEMVRELPDGTVIAIDLRAGVDDEREE